MIVSYFFVRMWMIKNFIPKIIVLIILFYIAIANVINFLPNQDGGIAKGVREVQLKIDKGETIKYQQGVPESYLYYYLMRKKGINVY